MYKEDIDLAWRLQNAGYKAIYLHEAIAYHERGFIGGNGNKKRACPECESINNNKFEHKNVGV